MGITKTTTYSKGMREFWKKEAVKNYLVQDLFDVDEIVRRLGGCPNNEDYKIIRRYYCIEFIGGEEQFEILDTTKEEFEAHKDDDNTEIDYRTELNYSDFLDKFWFDTFEEALFGYAEPNEQLDFISCVKDTFFELKFEGQAKMFLKNVIDGLNELYTELNYLLKNKNTVYSVGINKIQEVVINHYSESYLNTQNKIINIYKFIYPEIEQEFANVKTINTKLTREEILKKLIGDNKKLTLFEKYEQKLKKNNYLSIDYEWKKGAANLARFFIHCTNEKVIPSHFIEGTRGMDLLRQLYGFEKGRSIDSKAKREKQLTKKERNEFDFLDFD
ncbi:hypothetical protein [Flavobacterium sp. HBTb2-11-1]|uniref:hypothetical protein n=1 Tax=Flavobacterium sp. HBTb2-11-1 TaxID=2692212 RepID=UPI00136B82A7|nr:hypothetical protein [Flavobacterium sp. HBTb2-11-1]MXO06167.1 hypothetical protein [Flavobacterium sp. HBTb2-11-1]